jgi:hypothetical protein
MREDVHVLRLPEPVRGSCELTFDRWPDEVVVDFPSVAALVERMQASFFGATLDLPALAVEVRVTPRQAFGGSRVAVDVPLRRFCGGCMGRGEVSELACPDCDGTGERLISERVHVYVPPGVRDGEILRLLVRATPASHTAVDLSVRVR